MIPRKLGDELRRKRSVLRLRQADVARSIGVSRAYISAVERGVEWEPDAEKLVAWAKALNLEPDYLLRKTGRVSLTSEGVNPETAPVVGISRELLDAIKQAVAEGVEQGVREGLERHDRDDQPAPGQSDAPPAPRRPALPV